GAGGGDRFARRLSALFHPDLKKRRRVRELDLERVKGVTPVFLVYDLFWRFSPVSQIASRRFAEALKKHPFRPDVNLNTSVIIDIETLEGLMGAFTGGRLKLSQCLLDKSADDPTGKTSFREFILRKYPDSAIEWPLETARLKSIWNRVSEVYFGETVWP